MPRPRRHGGAEKARVDLEQAVLDAGLHPDAGGWTDPRVCQDAQTLLDNVVANAE